MTSVTHGIKGLSGVMPKLKSWVPKWLTYFLCKLNSLLTYFFIKLNFLLLIFCAIICVTWQSSCSVQNHSNFERDPLNNVDYGPSSKFQQSFSLVIVTELCPATYLKINKPCGKGLIHPLSTASSLLYPQPHPSFIHCLIHPLSTASSILYPPPHPSFIHRLIHPLSTASSILYPWHHPPFIHMLDDSQPTSCLSMHKWSCACLGLFS